MTAENKTFGLIGALAAFPRRLAAREVARQGSELQHRVTRRTSHVVFGRSLLDKASDARLTALLAEHAGGRRATLSENGFLRALGLLSQDEASTITRQSLIDQSGLAAKAFDLLTLFDAFERDAEPFSFRDLILARKYAGLIAGGATWKAIARSIHRSGPVASLTALSLQNEGRDAVYARLGQGFAELDGQQLLPLDRVDDDALEELFARAEDAEEEGRYREAAGLYGQCLAIDGADAIAMFNQANCLRQAGALDEAEAAYLRALRLDPKFSEAWFNLAGVASTQGKVESARRHLSRAIVLDATYADPVFNLAALEFDAGNLVEARAQWLRYLELDGHSDWSKRAAKGVRYVDMQLTSRAQGA